jgi:hypothetical protein
MVYNTQNYWDYRVLTTVYNSVCYTPSSEPYSLSNSEDICSAVTSTLRVT